MKEVIKKIIKKIRYMNKKDLINLLLLVLITIDLVLFITMSLYGKYEFNKVNDQFNDNEKAVQIQKQIDSNSTTYTITNIIDLIKKDYKLKEVLFIRNKSLIKVDIITDKNILFQLKEVSTISASMNIEPILLKENVPYSWSESINLDKYIYKPEYEEPKFLIASYVSDNVFSIIFYGLLIIYLLKAMPGIGGIGDKKFILYSPEDIEDSLDDLVGMDKEIKSEINNIKDMVNNSSKFEMHGISKTFNYAFSGPSGTGKTKTALALAKELNLPIVIGTGNVETGFVGGGASTIKSLFKTGESAAYSNDRNTAIIFLDEAQTLMLKRGESKEKWADDSANELLARLSGVHTNKEVNIIFITAANFDDSNANIDEAMARRFKNIYFRLPDKLERKEIIEFYLCKIDPKILSLSEKDIDDLAKITTGLSPAKIETIIKESSMISIISKVKIDKQIIIKAFEKITVGNTNRDTSKDKNRKRIIYHELGHFLTEFEGLRKKGMSIEEIEKSVNTIKISSESISKYNVLGYVLNKESDDLKTSAELQEEIISLYGGYAAEEVCYGGPENVSLGAYNDIEKISDILNVMVFELGLFSSHKLNFSKTDIDKDILSETILSISEDLYKESIDRINKNKELLEFLSKILMTEWVLYTEDIFKYIKEFENKM